MDGGRCARRRPEKAGRARGAVQRRVEVTEKVVMIERRDEKKRTAIAMAANVNTRHR